MWFFGRKATAERLLLDSFLQLEKDRLAHRSDLEAKRDELEIRRLEIELAHIEARTKAQIELDAAKQELRLKRQEAGRIGQQKRRQKAREQSGQDQFCCPLGEDPLRKDVTVEMVRQHMMHPQKVERSNGN